MSHFLSPGSYLPHDAPMLLLEAVDDVTADTAACRVTVSSGSVLGHSSILMAIFPAGSPLN